MTTRTPTATEATTTEEAAGGGGGATEVSMTEYAFDPADATVSQGEAVSATNDGELTHNYTIEGVPEEAGATTENLDPGEQRRIRWSGSEAGRVRRDLHHPRPRRAGHGGHAHGKALAPPDPVPL